MTNTDLFSQHINILVNSYELTLSQISGQAGEFSSVLIHSGSEDHYYADDRGIPFNSFGHFSHWLPVNRPDQMLLYRNGKKPIYFQVIPTDFWYDQSIQVDSWWADEFEIVTLASSTEAINHIGGYGDIAFLGENTLFARNLGIKEEFINPKTLLSHLNYQRAYKSPYEVEQLRQANKKALLGHDAAKNTFESGASEYEIHMNFLNACEILEEQSPYTNIVALDEKSAILHYQYKQRDSGKDSQVLLIDAGCRVNGYGSDITRTSTREHTHSIFKSLVQSMESLELELIELISAGKSYVDIHVSAQEKISAVLHHHDIYQGELQQALGDNISTVFMPHGVGHLLGIQVHDVGGHQQNRLGDIQPPPDIYPALRNTRVMEEGQVFTIEPGLYFIPSLLNAERYSPRGKFLNWTLIDELIPLGGIRIEDNIVVTQAGAENLTRG